MQTILINMQKMSDMKNFKDRLLFLFGSDVGPTQIAKKIGMTFQGFTRVWYDGGIPKAETLVKIREATGCDLTWLLTGEGMPYPNSVTAVSLDKSNSLTVCDVLGRPVDIDEFIFIPRFDIEASAGHGSMPNSEESHLVMAFRRYWITNYLNANPKDLSVIRIKGDSMQGVLNDGDNVLINLNKNKPQDGLFVLRIDGSLFAKRLQIMPDSKLLIKSANKDYESYVVDLKSPPSDFQIIGAIEWFGRQINHI